jgi:hypothetical protein
MSRPAVTGRRGTRPGIRAVAWLGLLLMGAPLAHAHRLDEYLQATFLAVATNEVRLELCLTPGVGVAPAILAQLDADHDGRISDTEGAAYAEQVRQALRLGADGTSHRLELTGTTFPAVAELREGVGIIRLNLRAVLGNTAPGLHQLTFENRHLTNLSVYLVNALMPESRAIEITQQTRDYLQNSLRLDYKVSADGPIAQANTPIRPPDAPASPLPALIAASVTGLVALGWASRQRLRSRARSLASDASATPGDR